MILPFLQCVSTVIIVYIIISSLNSYLYIHWILLLQFAGLVDLTVPPLVGCCLINGHGEV